MAEEKTKVVDDDLIDPTEFDETDNGSNPTDKGEDNVDEDSNNSNETKSEEDLEKEKRAEFARKRREKEAREKAEKEQREKEELIRKEAATKAKLGLIKENPYTKKPIVDEKDLEIYEIMKDLEDKGLDPLEDLPSALAERSRNLEKKATEEQKTQQVIDDQLRKEIDELRKKYPDINTKELADDPLYNEIAEAKAGRWTITEIYEEYLRQKGSPKKTGQETEDNTKIEEIAKVTTKQTSATGGSSTTGGSKPIAEMTDEEFREYYRKKYNR